MKQLTYKQKLDMITTHSWEIWTRNGNKLNAEERAATEQKAKLAAEMCFYQGISDLEWLAATIKELEGSPR